MGLGAYIGFWPCTALLKGLYKRENKLQNWLSVVSYCWLWGRSHSNNFDLRCVQESGPGWNIIVVSLPRLIDERAYRYDLSINTGCCYNYVWWDQLVLSSKLCCSELVHHLQGPVCLRSNHTCRTLQDICKGEVGDKLRLDFIQVGSHPRLSNQVGDKHDPGLLAKGKADPISMRSGIEDPKIPWGRCTMKTSL